MEIITLIVSIITTLCLIQQYRETRKQNSLNTIVQITTDFFNPLEQDFKKFDATFFQDSIKYFYDNMFKNYTSLNIKNFIFNEPDSELENITLESSQHGLIDMAKLYYISMPELDLEKYVFTKNILEREIMHLFSKMETISNLVCEFKNLTFIKLKFDEIFFNPYIRKMDSSIAFYIFHDKAILKSMKNKYPKFFEIYFTNKLEELTSDKQFVMFFADGLVSFQKNQLASLKDAIDYAKQYNEETAQMLSDYAKEKENINYDTFKDALIELKSEGISLYDRLWLIYYSKKKVIKYNINKIQEENYIKNSILNSSYQLSTTIDEKTIKSIEIKLHDFINFLYCTSHFSISSFHRSISNYKITEIIKD